MIVHAGGDTKLAVALHRIGGEGDDFWLAVGRLPGADLAGGLEPVHLRHLQIHENEIVVPALQGGNRLKAVGHRVGTVTETLKEAHGDLLVHGVVLGEQHLQRNFLADGPVHELGGRGQAGGFRTEQGGDRVDQRGGANRLGSARRRKAVGRSVGRGLAERIQHQARAFEVRERLDRGGTVEFAPFHHEQDRRLEQPGDRLLGAGDIGGHLATGAGRFKKRAQPGLGQGMVFDAKYHAAQDSGGQSREAGFRGLRRRFGLDRENKGRALAGLALGPDAAAHELGQPLADGESESGAAVFARGRGVDLAERPEQPVGAVVGDTDARVLHAEFQDNPAGVHWQAGLKPERRGFARHPADFDGNTPARGEFHGVGPQRRYQGDGLQELVDPQHPTTEGQAADHPLRDSQPERRSLEPSTPWQGRQRIH